LQTKPDERLQTAADEVNAMRLQTKPDERLQTAADEVNAMRLQTKPDERLQTAADEVKSQARWFYLPSEIKAEDTDEVSAHSMPASLLNKPGFANPVWVRIVYDPEMECYQVI
jgi:HAMP domain-containing protein